MSPTSLDDSLNSESLPHGQSAEPSGITRIAHQDNNENEIDEQHATNATIMPITIHASNENDHGQEPDFLPISTYDREIDIEDGHHSISLLTMTVCSSNQNESNNHQQDDVLPTYKEQMTETTRGSQDQQFALLTSQENCNSSVPQTAELYDNSDQSTIPVAEAFIIHDESIGVNNIHIVEMHTETAHVQSLSTLNSSQNESVGEIASSDKSGQTGSVSDDESDSYDKLKQIALAAIKVERKFWIRLVFIALFLNSILVAGVVVGIFCGKGACSSSYYRDTSAPTQVPSPSPSLSPSRTLSEQSPKDVLTTGNFGNSDPEEDVYVDTIPIVVPASSSPSLSTASSPTLSTDGTFVSIPPVYVGMSSSTQDVAKFGKQLSSSTIEMIFVSSVVAELLIIITLIMYYRRWKNKQRREGSPQSNIKH